MTPERDHRELHDQQKRDVPLSLIADDGKATYRTVYLNRAAVKATNVIPLPQRIPEPPPHAA